MKKISFLFGIFISIFLVSCDPCECDLQEADAGSDITLCSTMKTNLNANSPEDDVTGYWKVIDGSAEISDINSYNTEVELLSDKCTFRWVLKNETDSTYDDVTVIAIYTEFLITINNNTLTIENNSTTAASEYVYDFGDGQTLTVTNNESISHTYSDTGAYILKLNSSINTCDSGFVKEINIHSFDAPSSNVYFGFTPTTTHFPNNLITIFDQSIDDADLYEFNFGDGNTTSSTNFISSYEHEYSSPGVYLIEHKVTKDNVSDYLTKTFICYEE